MIGRPVRPRPPGVPSSVVGSPTDLRLVNGRVLDQDGNEVKTRPLRELVDGKKTLSREERFLAQFFRETAREAPQQLPPFAWVMAILTSLAAVFDAHAARPRSRWSELEID